MSDDAPYEVHTLLRLQSFDGALFANQRPLWLSANPHEPGWVVVRRGIPKPGFIAAGTRGRLRSERSAVDVPVENVMDAVPPFELSQPQRWITHWRAGLIPALSALPAVASLLATQMPKGIWGPTGSVGLELASGEAWTTPMSDLDLMLHADEPLPLPKAVTLLDAFTAMSVRVDMILETPNGGIALADYARRSPPWLLRAPLGPRLTQSPWEAPDPEPEI